ncbi:MAG: hypothetical protein MUE44_28150 [Oscillatoriaceae cyanobacterium Prado104]|nr:hypothetical protein [Oscillatoriaceae cyanobacterium Prado104]
MIGKYFLKGELFYEHLKLKQILSIPADRDRDWKYGTLRALMAKIAHQSGDVGADFSRTNNPNGVWSYGWALNLRSPFVLCCDPTDSRRQLY